MDALTIGKVARQAAVGIETIRFYEREGLIAEPPRRESGYRQYPPETVDRVRFIKRAKELGFSLREIRELLSLRAKPGVGCADIYKRAKKKIDDIKERIRTLQAMRRALSTLMSECTGRGPVSECPILDALDRKKEKP
ncbi:MAG: heavy metal-responsive transcriptional regulator [Planctomycetota bacterium]